MKHCISIVALLACGLFGADQTPPSINTPQTLDTVLAGNGAGVQNSFRPISAAMIASGTLAVARGGTGIGSGTSGGVLAFTAAGTIASSGALASGAFVLGGGAGAAPTASTVPGTGVLTALAINTGTAGAFQVNNASGAALTSLNASNLASGTVADARLSANVPLLNAANVFTTAQKIKVDTYGLRVYNAAETVGFGFYNTTGAGGPAQFGSVTNHGVALYTNDGAPQFTLNTDASLTMVGLIGTYNNVATGGWGVPAIYGSARPTGQITAATLATYTVGAADGSFLVSANVNVTTATAHNFIVTCTYTDETNTSRTMTMPLNNLAGAFLTLITNTGGAVPYESCPMHIRCKAATSITIATANGGGTNFTSVVYNGEGCIQQIK